MPVFIPDIIRLYQVTNSNLNITSATQSLTGNATDYGWFSLDGFTETRIGEVTPILAADSSIPVDYAILNPAIQLDFNIIDNTTNVLNLINSQSVVSGVAYIHRPLRTRWVVDLIDSQYNSANSGRVERRVYNRATLVATSGLNHRYGSVRGFSFTLQADVHHDTGAWGQFFAATIST